MIVLRSVSRHDVPPALLGDVLPVLEALRDADREIAASRAVMDELAREQRRCLYD